MDTIGVLIGLLDDLNYDDSEAPAVDVVVCLDFSSWPVHNNAWPVVTLGCL